MEPLGDILSDFMASIRIGRALDRAGIPPRLTGLNYEFHLPSGFVDFDRLVGGLNRPSLMAIGGGPGQGKTAFWVNVVRHVAVRLNLTTVIFSAGLTRWQIARRFLSAESAVDYARIDEGRLSESDLSRLGDGLDLLSKKPIYIDDTTDASAEMVRERASLLHAERPIDLLIVDHLPAASPMNSDEFIPRGSLSCSDSDVRAIKSLCRELNVPGLVFFELLQEEPVSEGAHSNLEFVPEGLAQHADCIVLIHRAGDHDERKELLNLHVVKNREGPNGACVLILIEKTGQIMDLTEAV
jgi:replicative DNA helicase